MKSIFLCAGSGTRLAPYTHQLPKCMLPFFSKPLIDYQVELHSRLISPSNITVISGAHAEKLELKEQWQKIHNPDYEKTNMVYSLSCAKSELLQKTQDVIVSYGDIIYEEKVLKKLIEGRTSDALSVIIDQQWQAYWQLRSKEPLQDLETLKLRADGSISEIGLPATEFSSIEGQYIGLFYIPSQLIKDFLCFYERLCAEEQNYLKISMTEYLQILIQHGWVLNASFIHGGWLEFDTIEDYHLYQSLEKQGKLAPFFDLNSFRGC